MVGEPPVDRRRVLGRGANLVTLIGQRGERFRSPELLYHLCGRQRQWSRKLKPVQICIRTGNEDSGRPNGSRGERRNHEESFSSFNSYSL